MNDAPPLMPSAARVRSLFASTLGLSLAGLAGCDRATVPRGGSSTRSEWFEDVAVARGVHFQHDAGAPPSGRYFMPQIMGSGAALFDYDDDGRLDILLLQNGGPSSTAKHQLFHQEPDGTFTDKSAGSGLDLAGHGMGVAVGDVNNDGRPDVLLTEYSARHLFVNLGGGRFEEVTRQAGLDSPLWGTSACFFDFDRDGWLDLVVANYVDYDPTRPCGSAGGEPDYCPPREFRGTVSNLYRNASAGAGGVRFEDATLSSGLASAPGPGLGVVCADFNGDDWPDIFIANDEQPNRLWINRRDGTFIDEAMVRGVAYNPLGRAEANMGVALGDVDGNGRFDVFVTHLTEELHGLWKQESAGFFQHRTAEAGLASPRWRGTGFGTVLADFDNDGLLDLAVANGRIRRAAAIRATPGAFFAGYAERNQIFAGGAAGKFTDVSEENAAFCGTPAVSRGLACGDLDNDGGIDLLVARIAAPAALFRNVARPRGHWLIVRAFDPALRRDAYGARVTVRAGGRAHTRWLNPGSSYLCSNDPRAHFGLGKSGAVDSIEVLWPDGATERFAGISADQVVVLRKGEGALTGGQR